MSEPPPPPTVERKRGRQRPADLATPSPGRRRGCNCKKSGCLKLYCECFAGNARCGDRCQCLGCKNREHNRLEIAHAMEAIERRTQRSFQSHIAVARKLEDLRNSTPRADALEHTPIDRAAQLLMSVERLAETPRQATPIHASPATGKRHDKARGCSCKKSNCLKLYCECLAALRFCGDLCNCQCCKNREETHTDREIAISAILERNPLAFQPKVATGASQHLRGCNCRKSNCMKNYCECHQAGVPCTARCACQGCRNTEAFVSAKKMLDFNADASEEGTITSVATPMHNSNDPSKPPRRPLRRTPAHSSTPPPRIHERGDQIPSALEMLSRTAPPSQVYVFGQLSSRLPQLGKRTQDGSLKTTDRMMKLTRTGYRTSFQERIEKAITPAPPLPSIEAALETEFDAANSSLPLSKLCRSLVHAATSVESTTASSQSSNSNKSPRDKPTHGHSNPDNSGESEGGSMSPSTEDLLCEEDIETPNRTSFNHVNDSGTDHQASAATTPVHPRLTVSQERAVLQEFSVWLRNLTTSSSCGYPQ